jgi:hypothetical protein
MNIRKVHVVILTQPVGYMMIDGISHNILFYFYYVIRIIRS